MTSFGGISREAVADAVKRVVDALERHGDLAVVKEENAELIGVLSSDRMPDLAPCLRRDLQAEGVVLSEMGSASSGRHAVMTLRLPSGAKSALGTSSCAAAGIGIIRLAEAGSP